MDLDQKNWAKNKKEENFSQDKILEEPDYTQDY